MGAWGTGILEDDMAVDIHGEFMELYDEGQATDDILAHLLGLHDRSGGFTDRSNFWLGLAQAQWECGCLDQRVLAQVERIVATASGAGADDWWKARRSVLRQFLRTIQVPRSQPRPRTRRIVLPPVYEAGTCLSVPTSRGGFGPAIVLRVVTDKYDSRHLVACLRGVYAEPPTMAVFEQRDWLTSFSRTCTRSDKLIASWCGASSFERDTARLPWTMVGKTGLRPADPMAQLDGGDAGCSTWGWIENQIWLQDEWARGEGSYARVHEQPRRTDLH